MARCSLGGEPFFIFLVLGEFYGEDSFEEILNDNQEEGSFEQVPQVTKQNSV